LFFPSVGPLLPFLPFGNPWPDPAFHPPLTQMSLLYFSSPFFLFSLSKTKFPSIIFCVRLAVVHLFFATICYYTYPSKVRPLLLIGIFFSRADVFEWTSGFSIIFVDFFFLFFAPSSKCLVTLLFYFFMCADLARVIRGNPKARFPTKVPEYPPSPPPLLFR